MLPTHSLSATTRRRGLYTLMADSFLMWTGFFMIIPLLSVYYVERLGWAATSIGVVLAIRQFTQQGLRLWRGQIRFRCSYCRRYWPQLGAACSSRHARLRWRHLRMRRIEDAIM